jgi:chemotaxis regulatin CheY-phosphate phosphatase CheZ
MDLQTRKIQFIQEFLKCANANMLAKFEELLKQEREKAFEKEIRPMSLKEYGKRIENALDDVKNNKVKSARKLKEEIATWK